MPTTASEQSPMVRAAQSCSGSGGGQQKPPGASLRVKQSSISGLLTAGEATENNSPAPAVLSREFASSLLGGGYVLGLRCFLPFALALRCYEPANCPSPPLPQCVVAL